LAKLGKSVPKAEEESKDSGADTAALHAEIADLKK